MTEENQTVQIKGQDIAARIAEATETKPKTVQDFMKLIFNEIANAACDLPVGGMVKITGFGAWKMRERKASNVQIKHYKTGKMIQMSRGGKSLGFVLSQKLKARVKAGNK